MKNIFTVFKGEIKKTILVKKTLQGYRVKDNCSTFRNYIVFMKKQFSGWVTNDDALFYQQRSFTSKIRAEEFATSQLLSMEVIYKNKLCEISKLKSKLKGK